MFKQILNSYIFTPPSHNETIEDHHEGVPYVVYLSENYERIDPVSVIRILYCHGNRDDCSTSESFARLLVKGLSDRIPDTYIVLMVWDYPGYGSSEHRVANVELFLEQSKKMWDLLMQFEVEDTVSVNIAWGSSIGTGAASYLAGEKKLDMIVLSTPFASLTRGSSSALTSMFFGDIINNCELLKDNIKTVCIMWADHDTVLPMSYNIELNNHAEHSFVCHGDHGFYNTVEGIDKSIELLGPVINNKIEEQFVIELVEVSRSIENLTLCSLHTVDHS